MTRSDVLIVGGGPAGVAAALALRQAGLGKVTLLDREASLGGATRHCSHSPFGMRDYGRVFIGGAYGQRLERDARAAGVTVLTGHSVTDLEADGTVQVAHAAGLTRLAADRVLLATGAREMPRAARMLPGDRPVGILTTGALQAYVAFHGLMPFRRPLIVGSELVTLSAALTCLTHGARPVAVVEQGPAPLARAPLSWFPRVAGVPFHCGVRIVDILGRDRVEAVKILRDGREETLACDGLLLTGHFTPEAALIWQSGQMLNRGSGGPSVDQVGRCANPVYFAAGNLLRPIETAGWAFREGRAIGRALAADLGGGGHAAMPIPVTHDAPIKLVVPDLIRKGHAAAPGFDRFQLRVTRACKGVISLEVDGRELARTAGRWLPERRVLLPMPAEVTRADQIHFRFTEQN